MDEIVKAKVENFRRIEREWAVHHVSNICSVCDSPNGHTDTIPWLEATLREVYKLGQKEERQFILNILDGVDMADSEMGNVGGGTKAIRFALKNRPI